MTVQKHEWHFLNTKDVMDILATSPRGLSQEDVNLRFSKYGSNTFVKIKKARFLNLLIKQIKSPLIFVLLAAGLVTFFSADYTDALVILIAVSINTAIGVYQEGKASNAFDRLKNSQEKYAIVVRNEKRQKILAEQVVPGDMIVLSAGDQVPADGRIIESKSLEINESALTGEWLAALKDSKKIKKEAIVPERKNMVWMGTLITDGWGKAVVTGTGFHTELGKIAKEISKEESPDTPFQLSVKKLAKFLTFVVLGALAIIFILGFYRGQPFGQMFLTAVAIAVAAIPEGLPVAVSVVLSLGMDRMLSKGGLIKRLSAVETLGSVDVILTDKTGTLTESTMRVSDVVVLPLQDTGKTGEVILFQNDENKKKVLEMAIFTSEAFVENSEENEAIPIIRGRPLEQAVVAAGLEVGLHQYKLLKNYPRIDFLPFDSERRFAASMNEIKKGKRRIFVSGAPEYILDASKKIYKNGKAHVLRKKDRDDIVEILEKNAAAGMRIIGVSYRDCKEAEFGENRNFLEENLVFGGLIVFHDPMRPDAVASFKEAKRAGIRTVIVTGDHKKTAKKLGEDTGIYEEGRKILIGADVEKMDDAQLVRVVEDVSVFARVLPHHKKRIVDAWQKLKYSVAMTGDGINDAPALNKAEIGIALNAGTEVAKEASDLVLLNNSFSVIIAAIEEGRKILFNLRKILVYLLSTGFSEIVLMIFSLFAGLPLPFLPAQILWVNLIEEGFMNFAFAFEPNEKDAMKMKPRDFSSREILNKDSKRMIALLVCSTSILLVGIFLLLLFVFKYPLPYLRTIMFGVLSVDSIFFAFSLKSFRRPIWRIKIFSNSFLILALAISIFFLLVALFVPQVRFLLSLEKLMAFDLGMVFLFGLANLLIIEGVKWFLFIKPARIKIIEEMREIGGKISS